MSENIFEFDSRLDAAFLESAYDNDKEHAAFVFEQFLINYPLQIKQVEDSFISGDTNLLKQKLHKVKVAFSFVGLTNITSKAEIIERKCAEITDIRYVTDLYTDFKNQLAEFIPIVEMEFERLRA
jgi:hypothetical protein